MFWKFNARLGRKEAVVFLIGGSGVDTPMYTMPPIRSGPEKAHLNRVNCSRLSGFGVEL